jgi:hypothetical protein
MQQQHQQLVLRFKTLEDFKGTVTDFISPADQVTFERTYNTGMGHFETEQRAEWTLWFIWRAWSRAVSSSVDFEAFFNELTDYEAPSEDAKDEEGNVIVDPTLEAGPPA